MNKIVWNAPENYDTSRILKQHAFKSKEYKVKYIGEKYQGNLSLCGHITLSEGNERLSSLEEIDSEPLDINNCCIKCKKIFDSKQ
jgi:hypothetical protein